MARLKKRAKKKGGPYLAAAFFCENVIEDKKDNALSAIRIIDQIGILLSPDTAPDFPSEQNRLSILVCGLLSFKTGDAPGEHTVRVVMTSPSGKVNPPFEQKIPFTAPPHGGANLTLRNTISVVKGGLFWFDVYLDEKLVTRMPLLISVQRAEAPVRSQSDQA